MSDFKVIKASEIDENVIKLIGKDWMLVTAKKDSKVNTMTASWGGLGFMWGKDVAFTVIRPQRFTKEFIDGSTHFSLSFYDESYRDKLAYLGKVSGRDEDKISTSGLTVAEELDTPYFEEAKLVLICKKLFVTPFEENSFLDSSLVDKWYPNKDFHDLYISEIEKVLIRE
ncbi:flavin reductase family protein [Anaerosporobacter sp.]|uniref:flavin reductase family protein n=1 Tax=Anaerosporobacter sp. TaxID=1872529 RepID=UPI00286EC839|nr:flavin reductase family protein [Anaerosporobacter sp.]